MPESFPQSPQEQDLNNELSREEILNLRRERREALKAEKELSLETAVKYVMTPLGLALAERDFDFEGSGADAKEKIETKVRYYLQKNSETDLDIETFADAIVDFPDFINNENFGVKGVLEAHTRKTLLAIAERRKSGFENEAGPFEALFETESGDYYMARLTQIEHLIEESRDMRNCVGESEHYINRVKKGDIEILSFRHTPKFNKELGRLEKDKPVLTIEYNLRTKEVVQIKGIDDEYLTGYEPYFTDLLEALRKLKESETDKGEKRDIKEISASELQNIEVDDYYLFTEKGRVDFENYNEAEHGYILKMGKMPITSETPKEFAVKVFKFLKGIEIDESEISYEESEVTEKTKLYIGELFKDMARKLPDGIEHVYTDFPEDRVYIKKVEIPESDGNLNNIIDSVFDEGIVVVSYAEKAFQEVHLSNEHKISLDLIMCKRNSIKASSDHKLKILDKAKEIGVSKEKIPLEAIFEISKLINRDPELKGEFIFDTLPVHIVYPENTDSLIFSITKSNDGVFLVPRIDIALSTIRPKEYLVLSS